MTPRFRFVYITEQGRSIEGEWTSGRSFVPAAESLALELPPRMGTINEVIFACGWATGNKGPCPFHYGRIELDSE